jgi:hypothetical protein
MSERFQMDMITITKLITMPVIIRIVTVLDVTSLSILELLEYGLSLEDINYSIENRVISFDKPTKQLNSEKFSALGIPITGDYYYNLLKSKVKLTEVGLYILESIKGDQLWYRSFSVPHDQSIDPNPRQVSDIG